MDEMNEIESKMQVMGAANQNSAPLPVAVDSNMDLTTSAAQKIASLSLEKAEEDLANDPKMIDKQAKGIANIAKAMVANKLDEQRLKTEKAASETKVARKKIENELYEAKQTGIRLRKEAKHQSKMQRARHIEEEKKAYWEAHKDTLMQYDMKEGAPRISCEIIRFLDGVKGFFNGISKVSTALIKALRWFLVFAAIFGTLMIVPITRYWILTLLGFIKK